MNPDLTRSSILNSRNTLLVFWSQRRFVGGVPATSYAARSTEGRRSMNCTRIAFYDITAGSYEEVVDQARTGMVPMFERSPGFVSYAVAQIDKTAFVSLSTWHTREQA